MPREFNIVVHTVYDDLYPVDTWSSEVDYMRARDFLKALVGGPHGVSRGRFAGAELYEIPTRAQVDDYRKFKQELRKASPKPDYSHALLTQTELHIHCLFNGISMSLPYGTVENYRLASALASELTGPAGRTISDEGETFYLETREQLDAMFALQRKLGVKARGLTAAVSDNEKFILKIYHKGVVSRMPVHGEKRFLLERSFLDDIMDQEFGGSRDKTRPIGDPSRDFFEVNDEQFDAYLTFRQRMKREFGQPGQP